MSEHASKYEVHCYTEDSYFTGHGFPENSYFFDTKEEVLKCLTGLVENPVSGIWFTELVQNDFRKK